MQKHSKHIKNTLTSYKTHNSNTCKTFENTTTNKTICIHTTRCTSILKDIISAKQNMKRLIQTLNDNELPINNKQLNTFNNLERYAAR